MSHFFAKVVMFSDFRLDLRVILGGVGSTLAVFLASVVRLFVRALRTSANQPHLKASRTLKASIRQAM